MLKIGLTGGIGSGKSYIANIFLHLDVPVYNADDRAKELMNNSPEVKSKILSLIGKEAYVNNQLNRKYIASIIFKNKDLLNKINSIVHPAVASDFNHWCEHMEKLKNKFVIEEAAILFESGAYKKMDKNILVVAPEPLRIKRVMERDNLTEKEVNNRINNQQSTDELEALADFIIINDNKTLILPQIVNIYQNINTEWQSTENG